MACRRGSCLEVTLYSSDLRFRILLSSAERQAEGAAAIAASCRVAVISSSSVVVQSHAKRAAPLDVV